MKNHRSRILGPASLCIIVVILLVSTPVLAQTVSDEELNGARLTLADLPAGFEIDTSLQPRESLPFFTELWTLFLDPKTEAHLVNMDAFRIPGGGQQVLAGLIAPLSNPEQEALRAILSDPSALLERLNAITDEEVHLAEGSTERSLVFTSQRACGNDLMITEYVLVQRQEILELVVYHHPRRGEVQTSASLLAGLLDQRVSMVAAAAVPFRLPGPLTPPFTTYIPTPLELSPRPRIIFTNIFLAAITMMVFASAAEVFSRSLSQIRIQKEPTARWTLRAQFKRWEARCGAKKGLLRALRFLAVLFFYGLVFSLVDIQWKPFSAPGIFLFITMTLAFAIVGLLDDYRCLYLMRRERWADQPELEISARDFLLAIASVIITNWMKLVPGLFFGSPGILEESGNLDESQKQRLLKERTQVLILLSACCYLFTILTHWLQSSVLKGDLVDLVGTIESIFLIISAVALENLFVQMIGFPGTLGHELKQHDLGGMRRLVLSIAGVAFFHILINPLGELNEAIQEPNVRVSLVVAIVFSVLALLLWYLPVFRDPRKRKPGRWLGFGIPSAGAVLIACVLLLVPHPKESESLPQVVSEEIPPSISTSLELPAEWTNRSEIFLPASAEQSGWPLVFQEDFSETPPAWEVGSVEDETFLRNSRISSGIYRLEITPQTGELVLFQQTPIPSIQDFILDLDIRQHTCPVGAEIGVFFRVENADSFYYLGISDSKKIWVQVHHDGIWSELLGDIQADEFQPCTWNRLTVIAQRAEFEIYINGKLAARFHDDQIASGGFALGGWFPRPNETAIFEYDNFELRSP